MTTPPVGYSLGVNGSVYGGGTAWFEGDVSSGGTFSIKGNSFLIGSTEFSNVLLGFAGNTTMTGCCNTASGVVALDSNTTGYENAAYGVGALYHNTTGHGNTASGRSALDFNTTGIQNTAVGYESGNAIDFSMVTGSDDTFLGAGADLSTGTIHNATAIGFLALVSANNSLVLGSINGVNGATANTKVAIGTTAPSNVLTIGQSHGHAIADEREGAVKDRWNMGGA